LQLWKLIKSGLREIESNHGIPIGGKDLSPRRLPCEPIKTRSGSDPDLHSSNGRLFYRSRSFAFGHWGFGSQAPARVTDYLEAKTEQLQAEGIAKVSFVLAEGRGPEEIIGLARGTADNLVAMSSHGRSGIGRWVLGSVTDRVVSYCGDPVLVIRPTSSRT
jgi:hypothetical protein